MDSIINKLTEIESAASAIVQHAEVEKSALDEKFDKKRMDFDKELEADTQRQIQEIRDKLEAETSRILSGLMCMVVIFGAQSETSARGLSMALSMISSRMP